MGKYLGDSKLIVFQSKLIVLTSVLTELAAITKAIRSQVSFQILLLLLFEIVRFGCNASF